MRVAYTLEQCWHRVPGGTAVAALRVAEAMAADHDIRLLGVAGRHRRPAVAGYVPTIPVVQLPLSRPALYESWLRLGRPRVERATGPVDVAHATTLIPCPARAPLVVTIHDLAFLHDPAQFTRHGADVFRRALAKVRRVADVVLCSSTATMDDCAAAGIPAARLRLVPLGVDADPARRADVERVRRTYRLPSRFALFVGTVEPRKNLAGLAAATAQLPERLPLVVAGVDGWGDVARTVTGSARFLGHVPPADLGPLYAAATVFAYPSEREGFGLPILEAMAQGTPVVTSRGSATEETAGDAAVLVDPHDPSDIARGILEAIARGPELAGAGRARAAMQTWARTAALTAAAYREVAP